MLLKHAVADLSDAPGIWKTIAQCIPGRSNKACCKVCPALPLLHHSHPAQRWLHLLSATVCKVCHPPCPPRPLTHPQAPWTAEEDALLLSLYTRHMPPRWLLITKHIPRHTDDACSKRYREVLNLQLKKDEWTDTEDMMLLELTAQLSSKWMQVGHAMGCSGLGCRNRCVPHAPSRAQLTPTDGTSWSTSGAPHQPRPTHPTCT